MTADVVRLSTADGIARITLSNPGKLNAISRGIRRQLPGILRGLQADRGVRVVLIRGEGDEAFAVGADIGEIRAVTSGSARTLKDFVDELEDVSDAWAYLRKPVVARIAGYCIGGGLLTALNADIRIAASTSTFRLPAARLGLGYDPESIRKLVALVGPGVASDMILTARVVDAHEAHASGLVNRSVPPTDLDPLVEHTLSSIRANAPLSLEQGKAAVAACGAPSGDERARHASDLMVACYRSADLATGLRAQTQRTRPTFEGR